MPDYDQFILKNRANWEQKADHHFHSRYYDVPGFKAGKSSLESVELEEVGPVRGRRMLHLQCHFGIDSLCWARLGAKVTGVDFSPKAIDYARSLAAELNLPAKFICADVLRLKQHLRGKFDIVFVSYGCLGWLPDMTRWAQTVRHFLAPGGRLCLIEYHPVYWMVEGKNKVVYPYESGDQPIVIRPNGSYAAPKARIKAAEYWYNHGLEKILNALLQQGLRLKQIRQIPYDPHVYSDIKRRNDGTRVSKKWGGKIPVMFALTAERPRA